MRLITPGLLDAQKIARAWPEDFSAPSEADLKKIDDFDFVQICLEGKFLWCQFTWIWEDLLIGINVTT